MDAILSWQEADAQVDGFSWPKYGAVKPRAFFVETPVVVPKTPPSDQATGIHRRSCGDDVAAGFGLHVFDPRCAL